MTRWTKKQMEQHFLAFNTQDAKEARKLASRGKRWIQLDAKYGELLRKAQNPVDVITATFPHFVPAATAQATRELGEEFALRLSKKDSKFFSELALYLSADRITRNSDISRTWELFVQLYRRNSGNIPSREELLKLMEEKLETTTLRNRSRILKTLGLQNLPSETPRKARGKDKVARPIVVRRSSRMP